MIRSALSESSDSVVPLIVSVWGQSVILGRDLAALYGVRTGAFNQAVKRNNERFPSDFMFQLSPVEQANLSAEHRHLQRLKYSRTQSNAFTEHGAIMAATILNSPRAVEASIFVVRAFVRLRQFLATNKELAKKLTELELKLGDHDEAIAVVMSAIKQLMEPPHAPPKRRIGFR